MHLTFDISLKEKMVKRTLFIAAKYSIARPRSCKSSAPESQSATNPRRKSRSPFLLASAWTLLFGSACKALRKAFFFSFPPIHDATPLKFAIACLTPGIFKRLQYSSYLYPDDLGSVRIKGGPSRLALLRALRIPVLPLRLPIVDDMVPIPVPCSAPFRYQ